MSLSTGVLLLLLLLLIAWVILRPLPRFSGFWDEPRPSLAERIAAQDARGRIIAQRRRSGVFC